VAKYVYSDREMNEAIIGGKARVGIKIPWDYSDRLLKGETLRSWS